VWQGIYCRIHQIFLCQPNRIGSGVVSVLQFWCSILAIKTALVLWQCCCTDRQIPPPFSVGSVALNGAFSCYGTGSFSQPNATPTEPGREARQKGTRTPFDRPEPALLQNTFLVSVDNLFLISVVLSDTIYTIWKMNDFWYRLFRTDINNINRVNTQFSIGTSVVIVAERPCCWYNSAHVHPILLAGWPCRECVATVFSFQRWA
jgi:hypothetical protein